MIDYQKLITILIEGGALIASSASLVAAAIMFGLRNKLDSKVAATGFKNIAFGVFFIAVGILLDAVESYTQLSNFNQLEKYLTLITGAKFIFFVIGTYIIVIASKKTGDKLEKLTK